MHLELYTNATIWSVYAAGSIKPNWDWHFVAPVLLFFRCVPCQM